MDVQKELSIKSKLIDKALDQFLPPETEEPLTIHKAMRYSIFAGGKRLRPILTLAAAEAVGGDPDKVIPAACAIELIHTYSLIHDDLPALDNDDYRRGQLTNHKVFGEDMAILAGDALLTQAFFLIGKNSEQGIDPKLVLRVATEIANASGSNGMIGGQVVDLESENKQINLATLNYIHRKKTGALFTVSLRAGSILCGATEEELNKLTVFAENFGLAFQITDDILDVIGDSAVLGKPVGSDIKNNKATYPSLFGIEKSQQLAEEAINNALVHLQCFGQNAQLLREITKYLINRQY